jgi:hypothetical protein
MNSNFVKTVINAGGSLHPIIIPASETNGTGLMNPSIHNDNGQLILNLRHVNYTLYHAENEQLFINRWGPLAYLNPENDLHLRTTNFFCEIDNNLQVKSFTKIDTSKLDVEPIWEFVGLEDGRLTRWNNKLYLCGVRRDTTPHGEGRMEMSELEIKNGRVLEVNRSRIQPPVDLTSYCEKNWMVVTDLPNHFVKWTNPTEVVEADKLTGKSIQKVLKPGVGPHQNLRGNSQVIPYKGKRICVIHEVDLFKNKLEQKDGKYTHRFVVWDRDWNIEHVSEPFSFMDGEIEFACGITEWKDDLLVSFGFQDNAAYILKIPQTFFDNLVGIKPQHWKVTPYPTLEFTTSIPPKGCVIDCAFCPQKTLLNVYKADKTMTFENFKRVIDKLPKEIRITFSGFTEPWLNKRATDMLLYAYEQGHPVSAFTTGVGMTVEDVERLKDVKFTTGPNGGFCLHLPDQERIAKHPITPRYLEVIKRFKELESEIQGFYVMCMGEVHDDIKPYWPNASVPEFWSRAGNLLGEAIIKPELQKYQDRFKHMDHGNVPRTCGCVEDLYHNVVLPNGDVSLCCMDYGLEQIIGNIYEQEYEDIIPKPKTCFSLCQRCENGVSPESK